MRFSERSAASDKSHMTVIYLNHAENCYFFVNIYTSALTWEFLWCASFSHCTFFDFTSRQKDIGMEIFETSELFVKLFTPTFFVVITVIQLRYFHKDFLMLTDIECR
jgi:hypothetical protein